jgi:signal transduction histidine kinase/DNA-binding NarL/FixJ family response regulator
MSSSSLTLARFIEPAPVGEPTTSLATALTLFQSERSEMMAIVTQQGLPLGTVGCRSLLFYIVQHLQVQLTEANGFDSGFKQLQSSLESIEAQSLMEPVRILPAQMKVNEFCFHLQEQESNSLGNSIYALVDSEGKFVGLLNSWNLLQSLLATGQAQQTETAQKPSFVFEGFFFQFLEQLPLPMMVYTSGGRVLYRNWNWREQIGEFFPSEPGSFCPLELESRQVAESMPALSRGAIAESAPESAIDSLQDSYHLAAQLSYRQFLDTMPEILTASELVNSLPTLKREKPEISSSLQQPKTLGERAWQFVKFPLDLGEGERGSVGSRGAGEQGSRGRRDKEDKGDKGDKGAEEQRSREAGEQGKQRGRGAEGKIITNYELRITNYQSPITNHQSPIWLVLATEVTEQQRLCKELVAKNADLAQLNRLKDEFLACISHELKSPLTAVLGLSSLLKEQKLGELNQRQVRYAQLIYQSGRQLMSLVNDLLDLTRLETGQLKLNPAPVQIKAVCEQAYALVREKYQGKTENPLAFSLEIESGLETIIADELRLRQILVHLLDNAMKFTPAGKSIGLRVNRWENWLAFTIWDAGIGIPEEYQHLIFQKFQQLESPLTRQFEGTGLGLFLIQRLARAHGGDISFISKVGQGSQFTLLLPPSPTSQKSSARGGEKRQQRHPLVLIVEANPREIENLAEKLVRLDYRVAIARTGTEALEKARQLEPQAIFLNPLLPLLSGWDVLTLLKADGKTKAIPVIITATKSDKQKSQENGAEGFLSLPVEPDALQEILNDQRKQPSSKAKSLTILRLYPDVKKASPKKLAMDFQSDLALITQLSQLNHRILEADDLEQAEMLACVWKVDVVVVDSKVTPTSLTYLRSLSHCEQLSRLPLVTLDAKTTKLANQIGSLAVFPCLVSTEQDSWERLLQVIQIAAESQNQE